jgi:hypothetical protein
MDGPQSPVSQVKIVSDIPVVFADAVSIQVYGPGISKFYLVRSGRKMALVGHSGGRFSGGTARRELAAMVAMARS